MKYWNYSICYDFFDSVSLSIVYFETETGNVFRYIASYNIYYVRGVKGNNKKKQIITSLFGFYSYYPLHFLYLCNLRSIR